MDLERALGQEQAEELAAESVAELAVEQVAACALEACTQVRQQPGECKPEFAQQVRKPGEGRLLHHQNFWQWFVMSVTLSAPHRSQHAGK